MPVKPKRLIRLTNEQKQQLIEVERRLNAIKEEIAVANQCGLECGPHVADCERQIAIVKELIASYVA